MEVLDHQAFVANSKSTSFQPRCLLKNEFFRLRTRLKKSSLYHGEKFWKKVAIEDKTFSAFLDIKTLIQDSNYKTSRTNSPS